MRRQANHSAAGGIPDMVLVAGGLSIVALCIALTSLAAVGRLSRAQRSQPPSLDDAVAWQWVSTSPGASVFMHELSNHGSTHRKQVWVAVRFFSSPVTVKADLVELWEFDCRQHLSRRVTGPAPDPHFGVARKLDAATPPPWHRDDPKSAPGKILARICATAG